VAFSIACQARDACLEMIRSARDTSIVRHLENTRFSMAVNPDAPLNSELPGVHLRHASRCDIAREIICRKNIVGTSGMSFHIWPNAQIASNYEATFMFMIDINSEEPGLAKRRPYSKDTLRTINNVVI
jgi:hypothetical protein